MVWKGLGETIMVLHRCKELTLAGASLASHRRSASGQWDHRNLCLLSRVGLVFCFAVPILQPDRKVIQNFINTMYKTFVSEPCSIYSVIDSFTFHFYSDFFGAVYYNSLAVYYVHFNFPFASHLQYCVSN